MVCRERSPTCGVCAQNADVRRTRLRNVNRDDAVSSFSPPYRLIGPIPWGHSGPLCHALSLSSLWTSHAACAIAIVGVRLATPGDWQCNGGSHLANGPKIFQMLLVIIIIIIYDCLLKAVMRTYVGDVSGDLAASEGGWGYGGDDLGGARTLPGCGHSRLGPLLCGGQHGRCRSDVPVLAQVLQAAVQSHYQPQREEQGPSATTTDPPQRYHRRRLPQRRSVRSLYISSVRRLVLDRKWKYDTSSILDDVTAKEVSS